MDVYERDLEAVVQAIGLERFALLAANQFGQVAVRYAAKHPERVAALILDKTSLDNSFGTFATPEMIEVARTNWDLCLMLTARAGFPRANPTGMVEYYRAATSQDDYLRLIEASLGSSLKEDVQQVGAPTVIVTPADDANNPGSHDWGKRLAPLIGGARLILEDRPYQRQGETTWLATLAESFLDEIGFTRLPESVFPTLGLSPREVVVLRLIAAGKSNPQIAEDLVLSINTVQRHVSNILAKTGLANRAEAAAYAARNGID